MLEEVEGKRNIAQKSGKNGERFDAKEENWRRKA